MKSILIKCIAVIIVSLICLFYSLWHYKEKILFAYLFFYLFFDSKFFWNYFGFLYLMLGFYFLIKFIYYTKDKEEKENNTTSEYNFDNTDYKRNYTKK